MRKSPKGNTDPELVAAVVSNDARRVKELLEAGADPNVRWNSQVEHDRGLTPLMAAVSPPRSPELIELLLAHGANPHATTKKGKTALSWAVAYGNLQAAKRLLQAGCKPDGTLLLRPIASRNLDLLRAFIAAGADVNVNGVWAVRTESGRWEDRQVDCTLLDGAVNERVEKIKLLRNLQPAERAKFEGRFKPEADVCFTIIQELIRAGANPNKITVNGSPLYWAADAGDMETVKLLLQAGADPNLAGAHSSDMPLHAACRGGFVEIVEFLLHAGANVDTPNQERRTALMEMQSREKSPEIQIWERSGTHVDPVMLEAKREQWNKARTKLIELLEGASRK